MISKSVKLSLSTLALAVTFAGPLAADPAELSATQLRQASQSGEIIDVRNALNIVGSAVQGAPIDVRAFEAGGIFYRVLVKKSTGKVKCMILNAHNGDIVPIQQGVGHKIENLARATQKAAQSSAIIF